MSRFDAKKVSFVTMMSALGAFLSGISLNVAPILTAVSGDAGAALDLSHIATFIGAIFGGPYVGAAVGFLSGIYSGYYFGYVMGSLGLLSLVGIPIGKALTGLAAGFLYEKLRVDIGSRPSLSTILIVLMSYIPECIFTILYFLYLVVPVHGAAMEWMLPLVIPKAWVEVLFMSFLMGALVGNSGFRDFILRSFHPQSLERTSRASKKQ